MAAECGVGLGGHAPQGTPADMQRDPRYDDVVAEVHDRLLAPGRATPAAGVGEVWVDPGIGFGKTVEHNLALLAHVGELVDAGRGASAPGCWSAPEQVVPGRLGVRRAARRPGARAGRRAPSRRAPGP